MAQKPPPPGWVRIEADDPPLRVTARLAGERPDVSAGYGGWQEIARPRRVPITTWQGSPALRLTLPILLDKFGDDNLGKRDSPSIETQITHVQRMGRPLSSSGEPPLLRIRTTGAAIPYQDRVWVVDSLTWGDALMNRRGDRVRQQVTLALLEHVTDVYLTEHGAATRRRHRKARAESKPGASSKRVVAHRSSSSSSSTGTRVALRAAVPGEFGAGEDLLTIAARELGDADRWLEIAKLNGLRDPRAIAPGQVIRLP